MDQIETQSNDAEAYELLRSRMQKWDELALSEQQRRFRFTVMAAMLGPIAVAVLLVQIIFFADGGAIAMALIATELVLLLYILAEGLSLFGPIPRNWMTYRLRAELFRRELQLLAVRIGPYLSSIDLLAQAQIRTSKLEDPSELPMELIELRDLESRTWRDELDDLNDLSRLLPNEARVDGYIENRLRNQKRWHHERAEKHEDTDRTLENVLRWTLIVAVALSASHLVMLMTANMKHETTHLVGRIVELLATATPAVAAGVVALQSILQSRRLSRSYIHAVQKLAEGERLLLDARTRSQATSDERERTAIAREQARLILRIEETLAHQLQEWWLVVSG